MKKIDPALHERLSSLISSMGYELVGCEVLSQGRQLLFRIYIDSAKGVGVEDCSLVSHQVSGMMDVEDVIHGRYTLEVSSPGIDRPLFTVDHYAKYIGQQVKIRLYTPVNGRKQYKGVLQRVEGDDICLLVEDLKQEITVPFSTIEKGNLIGDSRLKSGN